MAAPNRLSRAGVAEMSEPSALGEVPIGRDAGLVPEAQPQEAPHQHAEVWGAVRGALRGSWRSRVDAACGRSELW